MMTAITSAVYALPSDNFDNNSMDPSLWHLYQVDINAWVSETNQRLELRSTGGGAAIYYAKGWGLSATNDFSFKIDFHFFRPSSGPADTDASVQFCINNGFSNDVIIEAGCGSTGEGTAYHSFFYSSIENPIEGTEVPKGEKERNTDNGTLYISYDASEDVLYLSDIGYGSENAWVTIPGLVQGEWGNNALIPSFGGWSDGIVLNSGDAYLDNFVVDSGTIVQICEYALAGDLNNDCKVNFGDFAIMAENWLIDCYANPSDPACVSK
jgi:hypothetical protein